MGKKKSAQAPADFIIEPPTREEVLALPHWSRVAFCARVARRLLPLVAHCHEKEAPGDYPLDPKNMEGTRKSVRQSERAAARAAVVSEKAAMAGRSAASEVSSTAECSAESAGRQEGSRPYAAAHAAVVIHAAASAALDRLRPGYMLEWGHVVGYAISAGEAFGAAAEVNAAMRADYETLKRLVEEKGWDDDTPVHPRVFGPLWPQGKPEGWPEEE